MLHMREPKLEEFNNYPILVTGASGVLGASVVAESLRVGVQVSGVGRQSKPVGFQAGWQLCDLQKVACVERALQSPVTVIHCASAPAAIQQDRRVLDNLIAASKKSGSHIVYVGIAGIERAALASSDYYRVKLDGEIALQRSGVSHTIVRVSQFHPFVSMILDRLSFGPLQLRPPLALQPVDVTFVARRLVQYGMERFLGRVQDLHGPERLHGKDLIALWLETRGSQKLVLPIPALGPLKALAQVEEVHGQAGGLTWLEWNRQNYLVANSYIR
jgi:uncharacterized protein YbjT (DUF2867 family)